MKELRPHAEKRGRRTTPIDFDPVDFIENVLMIDGVEVCVDNTLGPTRKESFHFELFDRASVWDSPAEVLIRPGDLAF